MYEDLENAAGQLCKPTVEGVVDSLLAGYVSTLTLWVGFIGPRQCSEWVAAC